MTQTITLSAGRKMLALFGTQCLAALALAGALVQPALADPPTRAGRVVDVIGEAWLRDPESDEWTRLQRNQTIAEGDQMRTDPNARVDLRIGSTSLWLGSDSDLSIRQLDDGNARLRLDYGDLGLRLRAAQTAGDFRVQTPDGDVTPDGEGLLRIRQSKDGTQLAALEGRARFEASRNGAVQRAWLREGEQSTFWWDDGFRVEHQQPGRDAFSDWLLARDRAQNNPMARNDDAVSPEMTGAEVLGDYGRWEQSPDYGRVWIPTRVAPGWAPYRDGHWVWTRLWGWSWVDDAPWGFAPFHYGRWVHWRGHWSWAPGRYVLRPVYAPALVAWVGGPQVSVGITIGARPPPRYGWVPLAPREVYVPGFRHSTAYLHRLNGGPGPARPPHVHANLQVRDAVSYLPGRGAPARPMAVSDHAPVRPLAAPPARDALASAVQRADTGPRRGPETHGRDDAPPRPEGAQRGPDTRGNARWNSDNRDRSAQTPWPGTAAPPTGPAARPPQAAAPVTQARPEPSAPSATATQPQQPWVRPGNDRPPTWHQERDRSERGGREQAPQRNAERERPRQREAAPVLAQPSAQPSVATPPAAPTREAARPAEQPRAPSARPPSYGGDDQWPRKGRDQDRRGERGNDGRG